MPEARPSIPSAACSPTALCNMLASLAVLVGFFLPHSVGCDHSQHRPVTIAISTPFDTNIVALLCLWPYGFALYTCAAFIMLALVRPVWIARALLMLPVGFAIALTIGWGIVLFSEADESRIAMVIAAMIAPLGTLVAFRMLWLARADEITAAAAWGQGFLCVLAIFSLRWFWFPPVSRMLIGGWFSIGSLLWMMIASWTWFIRARHDLIDRSCPRRPFQISLGQIVAAITMTAIALTYWRQIAG